LEEKSFAKPSWTECLVIETHKAKEIGIYLGSGLYMQPEDVEVVTEVKMIDPPKGNPLTKFWHALRNVKGEWRITSTSHIPDANYPPLK
jgi:purine nucleoside phosphorylase